MSTGDEGRSSYLDLLITTILEHEKNMDKLLERMQKIANDLSKASKETEPKPKKEVAKKKEGEKPAAANDIIYLKVKADRPMDEILAILETLKE
jgi:hypothetical protein